MVTKTATTKRIPVKRIQVTLMRNPFEWFYIDVAQGHPSERFTVMVLFHREWTRHMLQDKAEEIVKTARKEVKHDTL